MVLTPEKFALRATNFFYKKELINGEIDDKTKLGIRKEFEFLAIALDELLVLNAENNEETTIEEALDYIDFVIGKPEFIFGKGHEEDKKYFAAKGIILLPGANQ